MSSERYHRFTRSACEAVANAAKFAERFGQSYVAPEHLFLGLLSTPKTTAGQVLTRLEIDPQQAWEAIVAGLRDPEANAGQQPGLTAEARLSIELAVDEARRHRHTYLGSEHLLLALIREGANRGA
jgi:ATP-dependent Clp protease ATP-binding subunit ClpA